MGAMSKRGPIYPIFELDLPADKRQPYAKFQLPISIPSEDSVITTDGRTDGQTDGQTDGHGYIVLEFYPDQEYIYFIGSEMIISMSYKRKNKINIPSILWWGL